MKISNDALGWICCVCTCLAATLTTLKLDPYNIYVFTVGTVLYTIWGMRLKDKALSFTVVNLYLLVLYLYGFIDRAFLSTI